MLKSLFPMIPVKRGSGMFWALPSALSHMLLPAIGNQTKSEQGLIKPDSSNSFFLEDQGYELSPMSPAVLWAETQQKRKQEGWKHKAHYWLRVLALMAWLDGLEPRSSVIIWHPLNIVSEEEWGKTYEDNLLPIAPLPTQQQAYRQTEQQEAFLHFCLQLRFPGRKDTTSKSENPSKDCCYPSYQTWKLSISKLTISREGKQCWFCKICLRI